MDLIGGGYMEQYRSCINLVKYCQIMRAFQGAQGKQFEKNW